MSRHPFDAVSKRFRLLSLFRTTTAICLATWLAMWLLSFRAGRTLLIFLVVLTVMVLIIACVTWVLGTIGERQQRADDLKRSQEPIAEQAEQEEAAVSPEPAEPEVAIPWPKRPEQMD